jgi:hypothetical protein
MIMMMTTTIIFVCIVIKSIINKSFHRSCEIIKLETHSSENRRIDPFHFFFQKKKKQHLICETDIFNQFYF